MQNQFEQRKQDHIELALMPANQAHECNALDKINLKHEALPDLDFNQISIKTTRFKQVINTPFIVSSMTAGHEQANLINRNLIEACNSSGWSMGVGSQRKELMDPSASLAWQPICKDYPDVSLFSNIGIAQIINTKFSDLQRLIDSVKAKALIIHCNPLQECIQPEGTPNFKGAWQALEAIIKILNIPLIIKETGCGFSEDTLIKLNNIGITAIDVSGLGGTHWGRIEGHRAKLDECRYKAAISFKNWGITTVDSLIYAKKIQPNFEIWGSGGVRNGLDGAKIIALGASTIGLAQPLLASALISAESVYNTMLSIEYELKVAMFCTGSDCLNKLQDKIKLCVN